MDIISTSKQKKQQAALQSSCCLGVTFRLKWVSPQYEDISKTQWNMSDLHERHIKYLRSSNIQSKKKRYLLAGRCVTSTRKHVCNSFETWSLPSELTLRMTAGVKNIESSKTVSFLSFFMQIYLERATEGARPLIYPNTYEAVRSRDPSNIWRSP